MKTYYLFLSVFHWKFNNAFYPFKWVIQWFDWIFEVFSDFMTDIVPRKMTKKFIKIKFEIDLLIKVINLSITMSVFKNNLAWFTLYNDKHDRNTASQWISIIFIIISSKNQGKRFLNTHIFMFKFITFMFNFKMSKSISNFIFMNFPISRGTIHL